MATIVLTAYGPDRPGLVQTVADAVHSCGGNWQDSHLSRLAGLFVGSVLVDIPDDRTPTLKDMLAARGGLTVLVVEPPAEVPVSAGRFIQLSVVGQDRPGIVREVATVLADLGVNIQEIATDLVNSPWSGDMLFKAEALIQVPDDVPDEQLRSGLERVSAEIMVDIDLAPPPSPSSGPAAGVQ